MRALNIGLKTLLETDRQSADAGSLGALGVTKIRRGMARASTAHPFVYYDPIPRQGDDGYAVGGRTHRQLLYAIGCVDKSISAVRAGNIAERIDALITDQESAFAVDGWELQLARRSHDIDEQDIDERTGEVFWTIGGFFLFTLVISDE